MRRNRVRRRCNSCGIVIFVKPYRLRNGGGKFCSRKCYFATRGGTLDSRLKKYEGAKDANGCIPWLGSTAGRGYGTISDGQSKRMYVHRLVWERANGPVPPGLEVLHGCDNPRCVNLKHLSLGTRKDNTDDMVRKGRQAGGSRLPQTKLTDEDIQDIYDRYHAGGVLQRELAEERGVAQGLISMIVNGRHRKTALRTTCHNNQGVRAS